MRARRGFQKCRKSRRARLKAPRLADPCGRRAATADESQADRPDLRPRAFASQELRFALDGSTDPIRERHPAEAGRELTPPVRGLAGRCQRTKAGRVAQTFA
jgi:hypothetical protein